MNEGDIVVISVDEQARVEAIGNAVRAQLAEWIRRFVQTVRHSDGVAREVCSAFIDVAVNFGISGASIHNAEPDEKTAARCEALAEKIMAIIDAEVFS